MKEQIKERIEQLKAEYESGQKMLADLETQESNLRTSFNSPCTQSLKASISFQDTIKSGF